MGEFALGSEPTVPCLLKLSTSIELSASVFFDFSATATSATSPFTETKPSSKWPTSFPRCWWSHTVTCNGYAASSDKKMRGLVIQRFDIRERGLYYEQ